MAASTDELLASLRATTTADQADALADALRRAA